METTCFSANVRQCNLAYNAVRVQLCFQIFFYLLLFCFLAGPATVADNWYSVIIFIWFVQMEHNKCILNTNSYVQERFKNI